MKVVAYVEKIVPMEIEIDDKWKKMEEYGNTPWANITYEQDDYFEANNEDFYQEVCNKLEEAGEDSHRMSAIETTIGGTIMDGLQEY